MKTLTFEDIEQEGLLLYKYVRGSVAYGINTEKSDEDIGGVYMQPVETLCGLGFDYCDEIRDTKGDMVYF